ncbi:phosphoribosyl-AMP cyclohydrolase [Sedimentisphaera salicampi]|uniref:Phosphoribosyl-AMP cyclohydrolase n=1 Tax=Sedimentisphaera salicampi TaxID=1941349 RepID=A0A1W6LQ76_9BACT|nr:phosphoribosyl-AMP cyclohydrolase [Sedimentisphaera salicampi]ARN57929.1 phosphoribosyl-AMP cyclohydrolase [Sedimentisphaera salicampi]OXU14097.1 phosphoribosyl-AMP cyclohydrolase [Sedimentisphaera salicampi]
MEIDKETLEEGEIFSPRFNKDGLILAICQEEKTGEVLMAAYMNEDALRETIETGRAVFYSRSRGKLWRKGEQSGHFQRVKRIFTDCDQDCLLLKVEIDQGQCHVGYKSCFYREVLDKHSLKKTAEKVYDPKEAYSKEAGQSGKQS